MTLYAHNENKKNESLNRIVAFRDVYILRQRHFIVTKRAIKQIEYKSAI